MERKQTLAEIESEKALVTFLGIAVYIETLSFLAMNPTGVR